ncbi:MAG: hypothetical protein UY94_C0036G0005 [Parcubacteria group bacterium GW2011_GWA2_56_21]|nr:MAG: hypothetical protein UY94_C0036G0005 [Parcubacteria group bacterium GW2011_GWA2_56_21]
MMDKGPPEKYIRTFAGDMETLQKGGTPDLTPLAPRPAEVRQPTDEGGPHPEPKERLVAPAYTPPLPANAPLKTYAGDFSERMKETKASTATILAAEQDRALPSLQAVPPESSHRNILYSIVGAVLLIAGIAGVYVAYTRYRAATEPVVVTENVPAPIFVDEREEISDTGRALSVGAPDVLLRNVSAQGSMAGVVQVSGRQSPFFILSVLSYSNTFSGMLSWEQEMSVDLAPLFPAYPTPVLNTPAATTTPSGVPKAATTTTSVAAFVDASIANHDARVYRDTAGRDVLVYGYWNQATLIIARDAAAFTELVGRLATSRAQ